MESEDQHQTWPPNGAQLKAMEQKIAGANAESDQTDKGIYVVPIEDQAVALNATVRNLDYSRVYCSERTLFWIDAVFQTAFENH